MFRSTVFVVSFLVFTFTASPSRAANCSCTATLNGSESLYLRWWAPARLGRGARMGSIASSTTFRDVTSCDPAGRNVQVFRGYRTGPFGLGGTSYGSAMGNENDGRWEGVSRVDDDTIKIPVVRAGKHDLRRPRGGEKTYDYVQLVCRVDNSVAHGRPSGGVGSSGTAHF